MQYYRLLLCLVIMLCSAQQVSAIWQPLTGHITMQNGLPSNVVYEVYEDSKGFIWFCTDQGISRYDGSTFRNYSIKDGLPDIEVFRIREDSQHRYWLVCYNRKACYLKNGKIYNSENDSLCRRIEQEDIQYDELFTDRDGNECLAGKKIAVLGAHPSYIRVLNHILSWGRVRHFKKDGEDYIATGPGVWNVQTGQFMQFSRGYTQASFYNGVTLFSSGFSRPDKGQVLEEWQLGPNSLSLKKDYPSPGIIYQITAAANGLQISTSAGMMLFDTLTRKIIPDTTFPAGIPVNCMIADREGNRWLTTLNDGVYFIPVNGGRLIDRTAGLKKNNILSIALHNDGHIIAGDDAGHVYRIKEGSIQTYALLTAQNNNRVIFIRDNGQGTMAAGSDVGLYIINHTGIPKLAMESSMKAGVLSGRYFYTGGASGLMVYDTLTQKHTDYQVGRVTAMAIDNNQTLWTGGINGLSYFTNGKPVKYTQDTVLTDCFITAILPAPGGGIIAGSSTRGLFIIQDPRQQPLHLDMGSGLASNNCRKLFVSDNGYVWVCSNAGIDRIRQTGNGRWVVSSFPMPQGVAGNQVNDLVEKDGRLYLATAQGILILNSRDTFPSQPPRLYIESVNGIALTGQPLRFQYTERSLQVAYTGLSYSGGTPLQYRYLLTGGTNDTLYTYSQAIDLTALSPGSYNLLLWCRSPGSKWTAEPVQLSFTIMPPFWHHPLLITLAALAAGTLILLLFRLRIRKIQKRATQENQHRQQLAQLEMNALRAQINPHFIFNALNAIQYYYSQNDEITANQYLTSFAHFIRLTLTHSQAHWLPLNEEIAMLRTYIALEQLRFRELFTLDITVAPDLDQEKVAIPAMLMQPYVENAINHGLRHLKNRKGRLQLSFTLEHGNLCCIIDDNGIGREQAAAYKKVHHTSLGMKITDQRIHTINRMYGITIQVYITDKPDTGSGPEGTRVSLVIPLKLIDK